jgi:hypothetical protein
MIALIIWLGLSACAGHREPLEIDPYAEQTSLNVWLETSLIPYLLQQLDQHPRFRGQPFLLVRMQGENVLPRIDDLTDQIRQKITDALLKKSGLDLAWRPAVQPWQHHQRLEDISCGDYRKVRYFVGIDVGLSGEKRKIYVKVRALNLAEQKWVSGFGKSWQATPTREQLEALAREHPDEYLRGLRPLPFSSGQPDMLAAYLARNLSCLLRQGEADDLVVHVAAPAANTPKIFKTMLKLVGHYLTRFREVEVTDRPDQANISLVAGIHPIEQNLHQVWISARDRQGQKYLPGAETEAYVMIDKKPQPLNLGPDQAKPYDPFPPIQRITSASAIISTFDLLTPLNQKLCSTERPWSAGAQWVDPHEPLLTGSCIAIEIISSTPAWVFLMGQDAIGELTRIFPSNCPTLAEIDSLLQPGQRFQFPSMSDEQDAALELGGSPGTERIYAVAITTPELADMFADRMEEIQGLCHPGRKFPTILLANSRLQPLGRIQGWQNYLKQLSLKYPGQLEWREFKFRHLAARRD